MSASISPEQILLSDFDPSFPSSCSNSRPASLDASPLEALPMFEDTEYSYPLFDSHSVNAVVSSPASLSQSPVLAPGDVLAQHSHAHGHGHGHVHHQLHHALNHHLSMSALPVSPPVVPRFDICRFTREPRSAIIMGSGSKGTGSGAGSGAGVGPGSASTPASTSARVTKSCSRRSRSSGSTSSSSSTVSATPSASTSPLVGPTTNQLYGRGHGGLSTPSDLPPIVVSDPSDAASVRRARNTEAARRSRAKRNARLDELEMMVSSLMHKNQTLEAENRILRALTQAR